MSNASLFFEPLEPRLLLAATWTVLAYMDGDNNLEGAAIIDVNEMESVGSTASVNIAVQLDRISGYDSSNGNWTDARRGLIVQDSSKSTKSSLPIGTSIGEVDMGDPATLVSFIQWGVATYPATHYALVLWDHGGGTRGISWDDTSGSNLSVADVAQAINSAGVHFDIVGFDACLMGMMEIAYELRNNTDIMVGSEQTEPWDGWPYDTVLADLVASPSQTPAAFASSIVTRYGQSYNGAETLSAVTASGAQSLATALDTFANTVITQNTDWTAISAARTAANYYTNTDFRDLGTFLSGVASSASNAGIVAAANAARTAYNAAVIANHSGPSEGATGLSVYLPVPGGTVDSSYPAANFDLAADTQWDEFLAALTASSGGGTDLDGTLATANAVSGLPSTFSGSISQDGAQDVGARDVDFYALSVVAGQAVGFDIDARDSGSSLDSVLRLFDSAGTQLAMNDDGYDPDTNVSSYDSYIAYTFTKTETVYIAVSGYHNSIYNPAIAGSGVSGSTGDYQLVTTVLHDNAVDLSGTVNIPSLPAHVQTRDRARSVRVPVTVTNNGGATVKGKFVIDLYASTDTALDKAADTKLGSLIVSTKFRPGRSKTIAFRKIVIPNLLPLGACYLIADIDANNSISETDEINNTAVTANTIDWRGTRGIRQAHAAMPSTGSGRELVERSLPKGDKQ